MHVVVVDKVISYKLTTMSKLLSAVSVSRRLILNQNIVGVLVCRHRHRHRHGGWIGHELAVSVGVKLTMNRARLVGTHGGALRQDEAAKSTVIGHAGSDRAGRSYRRRKSQKAPPDPDIADLPPMENPALKLGGEDRATLEAEWARHNDQTAEVARRKLSKVVDKELDQLTQAYFPLPPTMSMAQWKRLLRLVSKEMRCRYLEELARRIEDGDEDDCIEDPFYEDLVLKDNQQIMAHAVSPEAFSAESYLEEIAMEGISLTEAKERLFLAAGIASRMLSVGMWLPSLPPERQMDRRSVIRESTCEMNAFSVLFFMSNNVQRDRCGAGDFVRRRARVAKFKRKRKVMTKQLFKILNDMIQFKIIQN